MMNTGKQFVLLIAIATLSACGARHNHKSNHIAKQQDSFTLGVVSHVQMGKDGYTAEIKTNDHKTCFGTISRANLKDPSQYRAVKIGDTIAVKGDMMMMEDEVHMTVRELR